MAALTIETGTDGRVWVTLMRFSDADLARLKKIPGHRWNPERKQWSFPDTLETRKALAEIVALPPAPPPKYIAVKPRPPLAPPASQGENRRQQRGRYVPGRDEPLTTNPPHPFLKQVDDELVLRGMAYGTRKSYGQHRSTTLTASPRNYFDWLTRERIEPARATRDQIRAYLVQMAMSGRVSAAYCRGARSALIFLYEVVLKQRDKVCELPRMKRPEQLPIVLSREEIAQLFRVTYNLKHKALLMVAYSAGLRVGEAVRLKITDIDSQRMQIRITAGKGAKDRDTLLSETALQVLRAYVRTCKPKEWLFPGEEPGDHLSERSAQQIFQDARRTAGIRKPATFHCLRHSFATHLLEDKVDVRYIQELMGHDSIKTTERYTHVTERGLGQIKSPLDRIQGLGGKNE